MPSMVVADRALWWKKILTTPRGPGVLLSASHPRPMAELGVTGRPAGERAAIFVARRDPVDIWGVYFPALCFGLVASVAWVVGQVERMLFSIPGLRLEVWAAELGGGPQGKGEACQLKRGRRGRDVGKGCHVRLAQLVPKDQQMQCFGDAMSSKNGSKSSTVTISSLSVVLPLKSIEGERRDSLRGHPLSLSLSLSDLIVIIIAALID